MYKITILLSVAVYCECVYVYSSFWAPLLDPRVLRYRVDARFDRAPAEPRLAYQEKYGYRGENLIADLSNGKGPSNKPTNNKVNGDVNWYYTYPEATDYGVQ